MNKICQTTVARLLLLLATLWSFPSISWAQSDHAPTTLYSPLLPKEEPPVRRAALLALRNISRARSAIHRNKLASARRDLAEAGLLLGTVRDDLSTAPVKNFIKIAREHLEYEQAHQVVQDFPLIYSSLAMISGYLPTDKAKQHIDRAKQDLERNDKRGADRELALADDSLIILEVEFPLTVTQQKVETAQGYLGAGKPGKANKTLQTAEETAITLYTGMNSPPFPLFEAKKNLWLALRGYPTPKVSDQGPFLEQARINLEKAAAGRSGARNEEAGRLSKEIAGLEQKLSSEGQVAIPELKAAWEKSKALAERDADYLAASWEKEMAGQAREDNLIEAKLHLAYAESYQMTTAEPAKAVGELDKTEAYFAKALKNGSLGLDARRKIAKLTKEVEYIKLHTEKRGADAQQSYDAISAELNGMVHHVETSGQIQKMQGNLS